MEAEKLKKKSFSQKFYVNNFTTSSLLHTHAGVLYNNMFMVVLKFSTELVPRWTIKHISALTKSSVQVPTSKKYYLSLLLSPLDLNQEKLDQPWIISIYSWLLMHYTFQQSCVQSHKQTMNLKVVSVDNEVWSLKNAYCLCSEKGSIHD